MTPCIPLKCYYFGSTKCLQLHGAIVWFDWFVAWCSGWDLKPCSVSYRYKHFGGTCYSHFGVELRPRRQHSSSIYVFVWQGTCETLCIISRTWNRKHDFQCRDCPRAQNSQTIMWIISVDIPVWKTTGRLENNVLTIYYYCLLKNNKIFQYISLCYWMMCWKG
jgi:hypothetical protein